MPMGGLYYEQFSVGQRFDHVLRRTVTEADNLIFSALTHNPATHLPEYHQGVGPEAGIFQLVTLIVIALDRLKKRYSRASHDLGCRKAEEAKRVLNEVKAEAKKR